MLEIKENTVRFTNLRTSKGDVIGVERNNIPEGELNRIQINAIKMALETKRMLNL